MSKGNAAFFILGMIVLAIGLVTFVQRSTSVVRHSQTPPRRNLFMTQAQGSAVAVAVNQSTFVQLHMDATETTIPANNFEIVGGDVFCNETTERIENIEYFFGATIERISGASPQMFEIAGGQCSDCRGDSFPQLVSGDEVPTMIGNIVMIDPTMQQASFTVIAEGSLEPNECAGLMAKAEDVGGSGDTLAVSKGRLALYFTDRK